MRYANPDYLEITLEYTKLLDLINTYTNDEELIEELSSDIIYSILAGTDMNCLIQTIIDNLPEIDSEIKFKNVADIIMNLINNTRTPENIGNTPKELSKKRPFSA